MRYTSSRARKLLTASQTKLLLNNFSATSQEDSFCFFLGDALCPSPLIFTSSFFFFLGKSLELNTKVFESNRSTKYFLFTIQNISYFGQQTTLSIQEMHCSLDVGRAKPLLYVA